VSPAEKISDGKADVMSARRRMTAKDGVIGGTSVYG